MTIVFKYSGKAEGGLASWATVALPYSYSKNLPDLMMFRVSDFRPATNLAPGNTVVPGVTKFPIYRVQSVGGGVVLNGKPPSDPHSEIWALSGIFPTYAPLGRPGANNTVWGTFAGENLVQPNPNDEIITPPLNGLIGDLEYPTPQDVYYLQSIGLPAPNITFGQETIENYRMPRGSGTFVRTPWQKNDPIPGRIGFPTGFGFIPLVYSLQDGEAPNYGGEFNPNVNPNPPQVACPYRTCFIGENRVDHSWIGVDQNSAAAFFHYNYYWNGQNFPQLPLSSINPINFPAGRPDPRIWFKIKNPPYVTDSTLETLNVEDESFHSNLGVGFFPNNAVGGNPQSYFDLLEESPIRQVIRVRFRTNENGINLFFYYYLYKNFDIIPFSIRLVVSDRRGLDSYSEPIQSPIYQNGIINFPQGIALPIPQYDARSRDYENFDYGNHNPEHVHLQSLYIASDMPMAIHNAAFSLPFVGPELGRVEQVSQNPNNVNDPGEAITHPATNLFYGDRKYLLRIDGDHFIKQTIAYGPENGPPEVNLTSTTHYRKYYSEGGGNYWYGIQWNNESPYLDNLVGQKEMYEYGLPDGTYIWTKGNC